MGNSVLYVEKFNHDKTIGMTTNLQMILYNANLLDSLYDPDSSSQNIVIPAGRFVAVIATDIDKKLGMFFMDFKQSDAKAIAVSTQYQNEETRRLFMKVHYEVKASYKKNYNKFKVEVNSNFSQNMSAN